MALSGFAFTLVSQLRSCFFPIWIHHPVLIARFLHLFFSLPGSGPPELPANALSTMPNRSITVQTVTGVKVDLTVQSSDRVMTLKEQLERRVGIPPGQQRILFEGKPVADELTIEEAGIPDKASVHLVFLLRKASSQVGPASTPFPARTIHQGILFFWL